MKKNKQLWFIGGGEVQASRADFLDRLRNWPYEIDAPFSSWKPWIISGLSQEYKAVKPSFPNTFNADYEAWKIWFEKYFKYTEENPEVTFVAHSLGGIFLAKYLSENRFPIKIHTIHFIAPVFNDDGLNDEVIGNFAFDPENLQNLQKQVDEIHFWHSKDDPVVPFSHSESYRKYLPNSEFHIFENRGHFVNQAHFVELFEALVRK